MDEKGVLRGADSVLQTVTYGGEWREMINLLICDVLCKEKCLQEHFSA